MSVGVKAYSATHDHDVHFHQVNRGTGSRIGYDKVDKSTGDPVDTDDIELAYEVSKGRLVTFDPDEVAELRPRTTRTVEVTDFVELAAIDPVFFDHTYWLAPSDEGAERPYRLLARAMEETGRAGIGTVVMRNKQYLAAIRPRDGALAMSTMRFADEVVAADDLDEVPSGGRGPAKKELALATQIVDALASDWDPTRYHDTYTEELRRIIEAKDEGEEVVTEADPEEGATVIDLMDALKASVDEARRGSAAGTSKGNSSNSSKKAASKGARSEKASSKKRTKRAPAKKSPAKKSTANKTTSGRGGSARAGSSRKKSA